MTTHTGDASRSGAGFIVAFAAQLIFTAAVVVVSRLGSGSAVLVMGLAALNALVVLLTAMGLRRERWMLSAFTVVVALFLLNLIAWPAWDVYERARVF